MPRNNSSSRSGRRGQSYPKHGRYRDGFDNIGYVQSTPDYNQPTKPDAWKTYGRTKTELEAIKKQQTQTRIPDVDNFEFGRIPSHAAVGGHGGLAGGGGIRKPRPGAGFMLPPRPPDTKDASQEKMEHEEDLMSHLDLNDTASVVASQTKSSRDGTASTSYGSERPVYQTNPTPEGPTTPAMEEEFPPWHQPFRHKKVKSELKKLDRQPWQAPVSDLLDRSPSPDNVAPAFDLMMFLKSAKNKKKGGNSAANNLSRDYSDYRSREQQSFTDSSESDAAVASPFGYGELDNDVSTEGSSLPSTPIIPVVTKFSPQPLAAYSTAPARQYASYQPDFPTRVVAASQATPSNRPPSLPPKPAHPLGRPPSPSRFAKSRPIVTTVTEEGVVTTSFSNFNSSNPNGNPRTLGTGANGVSVGYYEEREVLGGAVTIRTRKPLYPDVTAPREPAENRARRGGTWGAMSGRLGGNGSGRGGRDGVRLEMRNAAQSEAHDVRMALRSQLRPSSTTPQIDPVTKLPIAHVTVGGVRMLTRAEEAAQKNAQEEEERKFAAEEANRRYEEEARKRMAEEEDLISFD
ncbi:hypothetical protein BJ508DRAFT_334209 [Ascobolus immersus RN42]|uniref:Uncharacterized protein n=1 Tax=Ascobolus immersus RN42 TaxID=1160509 RepID=A0A3N4HN87_ASCIM|nr:hypothetical protein BJ508DRAFT_334209 [Ascobolus immersus RN42]